MDPARVERIGKWLLNLRRPASRRLPHRFVWWATGVYLMTAVFAAGLIWLLSDVWWPGTVLLFGPRWILLLPLLLLLPGAALFDRPLLLPLAAASLLILGPVMGLQVGWPVPTTASQGRTLRVVTLNAKGGEWLIRTAPNLLADWDADVAAFQECGGRLRDELLSIGVEARWLKDERPPLGVEAGRQAHRGGADPQVTGAEDGRPPTAGITATGRGSTQWTGKEGRSEDPEESWYVDARSSLCLASRHPILEVTEMDREALEFAGGSGIVVTYLLDTGGPALTVTVVHLETPRAGFELIRAGDLWRGIPKIKEKTLLRDVELRQARLWADRFPGPQIVVGDFNTPPESRLYRRAWGDWQNAFSLRGRGLGGTRLNGWIRARIDHILGNEGVVFTQAWVGPDVGSDHLPLTAEFVLR